VDLGPSARWDNAMSRVEAGSAVRRIEYGGRTLELDFDAPARRLLGW